MTVANLRWYKCNNRHILAITFSSQEHKNPAKYCSYASRFDFFTYELPNATIFLWRAIHLKLYLLSDDWQLGERVLPRANPFKILSRSFPKNFVLLPFPKKIKQTLPGRGNGGKSWHRSSWLTQGGSSRHKLVWWVSEFWSRYRTELRCRCSMFHRCSQPTDGPTV